MTAARRTAAPRPICWCGSSAIDLRAIPRDLSFRIGVTARPHDRGERRDIERDLAELQADAIALGGQDGIFGPGVGAEARPALLRVAIREADAAGIEEEGLVEAADLLQVCVPARHDR